MLQERKIRKTIFFARLFFIAFYRMNIFVRLLGFNKHSKIVELDLLKNDQIIFSFASIL